MPSSTKFWVFSLDPHEALCSRDLCQQPPLMDEETVVTQWEEWGQAGGGSRGAARPRLRPFSAPFCSVSGRSWRSA